MLLTLLQSVAFSLARRQVTKLDTGNPWELMTRCERGRNNCKNPFEMSHKKGHQVANLKPSEKSRLDSMVKVASPEEMSGQYCNSIIAELCKAFSTTLFWTVKSEIHRDTGRQIPAPLSKLTYQKKMMEQKNLLDIGLVLCDQSHWTCSAGGCNLSHGQNVHLYQEPSSYSHSSKDHLSFSQNKGTLISHMKPNQGLINRKLLSQLSILEDAHLTFGKPLTKVDSLRVVDKII